MKRREALGNRCDMSAFTDFHQNSSSTVLNELKFLEVFLEVYLSSGSQVMLSSESRTCKTPAVGCCSDFLTFKVPLKVQSERCTIVYCEKRKIICAALFITV